ncbi:MAG: DNA alkylation repair protein [Terracidiphilus sp.]
MPTAASVLTLLKSKGKEQTRKIYARHGMAPERVYGVSVADLKIVAKSIRGEQALACELLDSGNMDAMYLGGMVADGRKLTRKQLNRWLADAADLQMISEYTVPWLAVENAAARELAIEWIGSQTPHVAAAGWCTYGGLVALLPDALLDLAEIEGLLARIESGIHAAPNRVRYCMNTFVISVGAYVEPLLERAKSAARRIGAVKVEMGETACKVPGALEYIEKIEKMGRIGRKRKTMRC